MPQFPRLLQVGVLGGMGPAATVDFLAKVVAATVADRDQDHVPVIVYNVPQIPDRSAAIAAGDDGPFAPMLTGLNFLISAGAEVLAIPCNTAHHWHARLVEACGRPILHIADAAFGEVARAGYASVGLMATSGTVASGLYQGRPANAGRAVVLPTTEGQARIDAVIRGVKAGRVDRAAAKAAGEELIAAGAEAIILGCTELPLAMAGSDLDCIDPTEALARACVAASRGERHEA